MKERGRSQAGYLGNEKPCGDCNFSKSQPIFKSFTNLESTIQNKEKSSPCMFAYHVWFKGYLALNVEF